MAAAQVAKRYADSWLNAGLDQKALDAVSADAASLAAMLKSSADLRAFLASPLLNRATQDKTVKALADKAKFHALTTALLQLLVRSRRLNALPAIVDAANTAIAAKAGAVKAHVTSATPLDDKKIADIKDSLAKKLGKTVTVDTSVDANIIGGLVVRVGSTLIDDSIKTKLERMQRRLGSQQAA